MITIFLSRFNTGTLKNRAINFLRYSSLNSPNYYTIKTFLTISFKMDYLPTNKTGQVMFVHVYITRLLYVIMYFLKKLKLI